MKNQIVMLNINELEHHPENPRKNIGDISELTASIKKDGILQNLTVVKKPEDEGKYLVVIGNRRLEAALAAGLSELPCVVSDMDHTKQIETMLIENINRSDLTPIEEAEGFKQLTLAGFSAEDIAEKTGFSVSTINRRLKIAEYKTKNANAALERGATLADFAKLEEIKNKKEREKLLDYIGTNNFERCLQTAKNEQIKKENIKLLRKLLKGKATELICSDGWSTPKGYEGDNNNSIWLYEKLDLSEVLLKGAYDHFYYFSSARCYFCKIKEKTTSSDNSKPKHTDAQKQYERNRRLLNKMAVDFYQLRKEFVESLADKKTIPGWKDICLEYIARFSLRSGSFDMSTDWHFDSDNGIKADSCEQTYKNHKDYFEAHSAGFIINQIYKAYVDNSTAYWHHNEQYEQPKHHKNYGLDLLYEFLSKCGYQMCDDEIKCQKGTHELMQKV